MSAGDQAALGAVRAQLGPMRETVRGRRMLRERIWLAIATFLAVVATLVLLVVAALRADGALAITGVVVGLVSVPLFVYVFLLAVGALRTTLTVHDEGLAAPQTWGARLSILWRDVQSVEPARAVHGSHRFALHLHSGEVVLIDRLNLLLPSGTAEELLEHPDVTAVLDHYARWCQRHGLHSRNSGA